MTRMRRFGVLIMLGGFVFQFGIGACDNLARLANPFGTVLTGSPLLVDVSEIPDFTNDPSCTIPYACGEPPYGSVSSGVAGTGPGPRAEGPPP